MKKRSLTILILTLTACLFTFLSVLLIGIGIDKVELGSFEKGWFVSGMVFILLQFLCCIIIFYMLCFRHESRKNRG